MRWVRALAPLAFIAAASGCAPATQGDIASSSAASEEQAIIPNMTRVADWQLANMQEAGNPIRKPSKQTWNPRGWVQGTFFVGLADLADISGGGKYDEALRAISDANGWRLGDRLTHADDHLVALVYARYAQKDNKPEYLAPSRASFDRILASPPTNALKFNDSGGSESTCQDRWCWADALFMAPAAWMAVSEASGDPRYAEYADKEFWATADYLYDKEASLFFRDSRFFPQRGPDGEKVYWARGNGWVYGGIVNVLRVLPKDDPRRGRYITLFRQMSDALVAVQQDSGFWHTSLAAKRPEPPETSGTGFFTYGLAWGVNEGLLVGDKYRRAAKLGWAGLSRHVSPEGRLGYVQQIGDRPGDVQADDTQFYGSGAYLLAGRQMLKMAGDNR
jgi:rhamnogalacturonyl hydrolase YesR